MYTMSTQWISTIFPKIFCETLEVRKLFFMNVKNTFLIDNEIFMVFFTKEAFLKIFELAMVFERTAEPRDSAIQ